ncbi:MAG: OmpA family protein [Paludibacteraceae bacterium]|nr:OmpA family protein [Paludibacteraceae bacterium]
MRNKWFLILTALCISGAVQAYNDTIIRHFTDTVTTVTMVPDSTLKQREVIIPADSADKRGHYVEAHVGLGYGSMGYELQGAQNYVNGSFSALLQAQYAYFFTPNWGIGAGLWFTNYTSHAHIGGAYTWLDQTDTDLEQHYDHTANVLRWRERETIHNIGIPVSAQFQYQKEDWKMRIFASLGLAPAFSVSKRYKVLNGQIAHEGYYPAWKLTLTDMHEFGTKNYENEPCAKGQMDVRAQVDLFGDAGVLLPMTKQIDLFLGGYFNVSLNNANCSAPQALGWKDNTFTFMNDYQGAYKLDMATASHPWELGVKVGIHWHYIAAPKHEMEDYFEYFQRPDTSVRYIARADTSIIEYPDPVDTIPEPIIEVAKEVEKFNKIYFAFDSYQLTNKAKNYLNSIVEALNRVPEAKIAIDGHASSEGQTEYNDILSANRAQAVADYLVNQGVDKNRIVTVGHGSRIPNEDTEYEEMNRDRRVEVKVVLNENDIINQ